MLLFLHLIVLLCTHCSDVAFMVILHCILLCFDGLVAVGFGNKIVGGIVAVVGMEM